MSREIPTRYSAFPHPLRVALVRYRSSLSILENTASFHLQIES